MKKLVEENLITLPNFEHYQGPQEKPSWYNKCDLCDFHKIKGHKTTNCMKLKNIIQDLIESNTISIEVLVGNQDLKIYKTPLPNHNKTNNSGKSKDYTNV